MPPVGPLPINIRASRLPALAIGALLLVFAAGLWVWNSLRAGPAEPPASSPARLVGWTLSFPEARTGNHAAALGGRLRPGQPVFVPAGLRFALSPAPSGEPADLAPLDGWERAGGAREERGAGLVAPTAPGLYRFRWTSDRLTPRQGTLEIVVLIPAECEKLDGRTTLTAGGKCLGCYPDPTQASVKSVREHAERYSPPEHFAPLDERTIELPLAEGLALGQIVAFIDKRGADGRKIFTTQRHIDLLPPNRALYEKLAKLRERLRAKGVRFERFWITSGFRTPDYNKSIGGAAFSRHCYGDAADLCIDEDGDKHIDDLNADGKLDRHDGLAIAEAAADLEAEGAVVPGGIGVYEWTGEDSVRSHVHVDCRGFPVRWGQTNRGGRKSGFTWWSKESATAGDPDSVTE